MVGPETARTQAMAIMFVTNEFEHHLVIGSTTHRHFQMSRHDVEVGTPSRIRPDARPEYIFPRTVGWQVGPYAEIEVPEGVLESVPRSG